MARGTGFSGGAWRSVKERVLGEYFMAFLATISAEFRADF